MSPKNLNVSNKTHKFLFNKLKDKQTAQLLAEFDGLITLDPTIYQQGLIAIVVEY